MPKTTTTRPPEQNLSPQQALLAVNVLVNAGKIAQARALAGSSASAPAHVVLAAVDVQNDDFDQARIEYEKALALDDSYQPARAGLAELLVHSASQQANKKEWPETQASLRQACTLAPDNLTARRYLGAVDAMLIMQGVSTEKIEEAIPLLEKIQLDEPARIDVAHQLAMMYHRLAIDLEQTSQTAAREHAWRMAFGNWVVAIFSDEYWANWIAARLSIYRDEQVKDIPAKEIDILRNQTIPDAVKNIHQQYVRLYSDAKEKGGAARHQRLRVAWILEYDTAQALNETLKQIGRRRQEIDLPVACGPIMWKQLGLEDLVAKVVQIALEIKPASESARMVLDATTPVGLALAYQHEGMLQDAIDMLGKHLDSKPADLKRAQEVMVTLLDSQAESLVGTDLQKAVQCWEKAVEYGARARDTSSKIGEAVLKQAKQAQEQNKLKEANRLLCTGLKHVPDNRVLKAMLGEVALAEAEQLFPEPKKLRPKKDEDDLDKAEKILHEAAKLAGEDNPSIKRGLKQVEEIRFAFKYKQIVDDYHAAMGKANAALESFKPGVNYDSTVSVVNTALQAIRKAAEAFPDQKAIQKNYDDLQTVKGRIAKSEAAYLYNTAVSAVNQMQNAYKGRMDHSNRSMIVGVLREAERMLERAERLDPGESVIKKNLDVVRTLLNGIGRY